MYQYPYTTLHTHTRTCTHTRAHAHMQIHTPTCAHTPTHTYMHTHILPHNMHTHTTHIPIHTNTRLHAHPPTHSHTPHTHMHIPAHTHRGHLHHTHTLCTSIWSCTFLFSSRLHLESLKKAHTTTLAPDPEPTSLATGNSLGVTRGGAAQSASTREATPPPRVGTTGAVPPVASRGAGLPVATSDPGNVRF